MFMNPFAFVSARYRTRDTSRSGSRPMIPNRASRLFASVVALMLACCALFAQAGTPLPATGKPAVIVTAYQSGQYAFQNTYDRNGKLLASLDVDGKESTFKYNGHGHLTQITGPQGNKATFTHNYDADGKLWQSQDAQGRITWYDYDGQGRWAGTYYGDGSTETIDRLQQGHAAAFNLPTAPAVRIEYDAAGLPTKAVDGDGGEYVYHYDADGKLVSLTDADGEVMTYVYTIIGDRHSQTTPADSSNAPLNANGGEPIAMAMESLDVVELPEVVVTAKPDDTPDFNDFVTNT
jgi:YD repeat-containing protein